MRQISKNNFKTNVHDTLLRILSEEKLMIILIYPKKKKKFPENLASFIHNIRDC